MFVKVKSMSPASEGLSLQIQNIESPPEKRLVKLSKAYFDCLATDTVTRSVSISSLRRKRMSVM